MWGCPQNSHLRPLEDCRGPWGHPGHPKSLWLISRRFQKKGPFEPTSGPPGPDKSSLGHPQTLLNESKDTLDLPGDPPGPYRILLGYLQTLLD